MIKVQMAVVKKHDRETRAMRPFLVDERWADRIEKVSKGRIARLPKPEETKSRRGRGRGRKNEIESESNAQED